jgi:hypothetical protein
MSVRGSSASQQRSLHHSARCARYAFASLGLPAGRQVAHRVRSQRQAVTLTCRSPPCGRPFSHTVKWDGAEKLHRSGWRRHGQIFCCMQNPHSQALWVVHGSTTAWMQEVEQRRSSCRDSAASGTATESNARAVLISVISQPGGLRPLLPPGEGGAKRRMRVQARTMADTRTEPSPPTPLPAGEGLLPLRYSANQLPKSAIRGPYVL